MLIELGSADNVLILFVKSMQMSAFLGNKQLPRIFLLSILRSASSLSILYVPYVQEVTKWLDDENLSWQEIQQTDFPGTTITPILSVGTDETKFILHLLPTPTKPTECVPATLSKQMTDACIAGDVRWWTTTKQQQQQQQVIHLHQDVWIAKGDIVKCRLLAKVGRTPCRIFARKTTSRRIDAPTAMAFLQHNHLWGATKAKYYYGLFSLTNNGGSSSGAKEELVAVATFSSRRKIVRNETLHRSHELVRYCAKRDGTVVGGISKLLKAFIVEQQPDDIVTLVDRDWGPGSGWHKLGFETVNIMPPLVMVVSPTDGIRRHLVGAGIQDSNKHGRLGLPLSVMDELDRIHDPDEAVKCLSFHTFFPVHDTGVERLIMLVPHSEGSGGISRSTKDLWDLSIPTYSPSYYSGNAGITAMLKKAEKESPPLDSQEERASIASWRESCCQETKLIFSAPSSLDRNAIVTVQERLNGWRMVSLVGGVRKSIYHGIYKVNPDGTVDGSANVVEYVRTMTSAALAALESCLPVDSSAASLRVLHFGLGAGTLARLMGHYLPASEHVVIELDAAVVASGNILPVQPNLIIKTGDALTFRRSDDGGEAPFDCICIDVFGSDNVLPPEFYSESFLQRLRDDILGPNGIVIHNFQSGCQALELQLEDAEDTYTDIFESCYRVASLDSKSYAGNAILIAMKMALDKDTLQLSARQAQRRWGLRFDASARLSGLQPISSSSRIVLAQ